MRLNDSKVQTEVEPNTSSVPPVSSRVITLRPKLGRAGKDFKSFCRKLVRALPNFQGERKIDLLQRTRLRIREISPGPASRSKVALSFACSVVVDMVAQGWAIKICRGEVELHAPDWSGLPPEQVKERLREYYLIERDDQLRVPSIRAFIEDMVKPRLGTKGWASIFSLMRDGTELAKRLRGVLSHQDQKARHNALSSAIKPYLQFVESGKRCEHTGLFLTDIWRYFRHTWVSKYKSLPGRSVMILIRDEACEFHPVIGIAALGSSMAQQTLRDRWIGWDSDVFITRLQSECTNREVRWAGRAINRLVSSIYVSDLIREGVISHKELNYPTKASIRRLLLDAAASASAHRLNPNADEHKRLNIGSSENWKKRAQSDLFRSKRAKTLAQLLKVRAALCQLVGRTQTKTELRKAITEPAILDALRQLVRSVKSEHVGVDMMDIIVCGAVAPYNHLLGGKLVCSLLFSSEVTNFYKSRYKAQESIIASGMRGLPVVRPPNLVLLATTSLYGTGSSQYNRMRIPAAAVGGIEGSFLEFEELGVSKGFGSYHFSQATIDYLETFLARAGNGRKVNSIFGEGVNPLMRKIRDGLVELGLPADQLLKHGNSRIVYGVPLATNFKAMLLGFEAQPKYIVPLKLAREATERLAAHWRNRWLMGRISRDGVLAKVESHTLAHPIHHGAKVLLPGGPADTITEQG